MLVMVPWPDSEPAAVAMTWPLSVNLTSLLGAPSGPGDRVDSFVNAGYRTSGRNDSLLAKVIDHSLPGKPAAAKA